MQNYGSQLHIRESRLGSDLFENAKEKKAKPNKPRKGMRGKKNLKMRTNT